MGKKILIVTNANMSSQSGNVVLISRRAEEIYNKYKIKTDGYIVNHKFKKKNIKSYKFLNFQSNKKLEDIKEYIKKESPIQIIFYGGGTYKYIPLIKYFLKKNKYNVKIILDVQGALEERIEYNKTIKKRLFYWLKKIIFFMGINLSDGAYVVSDELKNYCRNYFIWKKRKYTFYKIRCGVNKVFSIEEKLKFRNEIRKELNLKEDTIIMTFSGYRAPWQNIEKIIEIFRFYDEKYNNVFFAFFCNIDDKFKKKLELTFPNKNYLLKFVSFNEYFKYLSSCDIGFIYRDYNWTNRVAFPNKFSDYLNAGLLLAINPALPEPIRILKKWNFEFINTENILEKDIEKILKRQNNLKGYYVLSEKICKEELTYDSQMKELKL